jgi:hypothetical protein
LAELGAQWRSQIVDRAIGRGRWVKTIILSGWNTGFNKVGLTKLLRYDYGYSLSNAKTVTDSVLDGKAVTIENSDDRVDEFVMKLDRLGVIYTIVD